MLHIVGFIQSGTPAQPKDMIYSCQMFLDILSHKDCLGSPDLSILIQQFVIVLHSLNHFEPSAGVPLLVCNLLKLRKFVSKDQSIWTILLTPLEYDHMLLSQNLLASGHHSVPCLSSRSSRKAAPGSPCSRPHPS